MVCEIAGILRQLGAIGGERELIERAACKLARKPRNKRHYPTPDQRFSAREAQLPHAARNERAAKPIELFKAQQIGLRKKCHVLRHAIDAAEIAPIGHRDAQIRDRSPEWIDQAQCLRLQSESFSALHQSGPMLASEVHGLWALCLHCWHARSPALPELRPGRTGSSVRNRSSPQGGDAFI